MVTVKVNTFGLEKAMQKFPGETIKNVRLEIKKALRDTARDARAKHRYTSRSNTLERATQSGLFPKSKMRPMSGRVFISEAKAPYGYYIHEGHRSWAPDRFIDRAVKKNMREIRKAINLGIKKAKRAARLK